MTASTTTVSYPIYPLSIYYPPASSSVYPNNISYPPLSHTPYHAPDSVTLQELGVEKLAEKISVKYNPGDTIIVCVDNDVTNVQVRDLEDALDAAGVKCFIIRGARAGTGFPYGGNLPDEDKRIDVLARIGEMWARRPDLNLTALLAWYAGEDMSDEDFAAAVEVHYGKLTDGDTSS